MKTIKLQIEDDFYDELSKYIFTRTCLFKSDSIIDIFTLATIKSIEAKATKMTIKSADKIEMEF